MSAPSLSLWICPLLLLASVGCHKPVEKVFEVSTDGSTRSGMLVLSDGVVVVNEAGFITRIHGDGAVAWRTPLGRELASRAVEARGMVVATSVGGEWFGVGTANGVVRWEVPRQPVTRTDLVSDGGRVYAVLTDGAVRCIDASTGAVLWSRPPPSSIGKGPLAAPVIASNSVVVSLGEAGLAALAWEDGAPRWRSELHATAMTVSPDGRSLFVVGKDRSLVKLNATSGAVVWRRVLEADLTTAPVIAGDRVFVGMGERAIGMDPSTGETTWSIAAEDPVGPVGMMGKTLVVPTTGQEGRVFLYAPSATEPYGSVRVDSPVRAAPVVLHERLLVLASDGRVLGFKVKEPPAKRE